ncbi:acetyl-CoA carboxylase biotin carboxyl carrier protein subunit [Nocardia sp. SYP-A9097]|uniref:acetyl-CoA carboxylase biotin carboxyl carrier protein n=1 Tax=Nocardia sp. SYP-A9097 TaxID=2663237 RepID=UPI00129ABBAB|nr:biotin/lipoyl-containing protein [Nocardia sp. SYP-A9097]MRH88311.1 acetyl-CoA carboxylase biotin carboxyl carrier protein subunit [Nocardia sp. SYP-A9097]
MTDPRTTESTGRAVSADEADHSLAVLTRHALTVRNDGAPAPTSVTVANGPVLLRISWEDGASVGSAGSTPVAAIAPVEVEAVTENGPAANTFTLTSETVGVFYRASEPGAAPFADAGDPVRAGQQVGIVEAMKLMIPITAAKEGVVAEFLVEDGEAVEHGQPLIVFEVLR